MQQEVKLSLEG